eukprot:sb/3474919/
MCGDSQNDKLLPAAVVGGDNAQSTQTGVRADRQGTCQHLKLSTLSNGLFKIGQKKLKNQAHHVSFLHTSTCVTISRLSLAWGTLLCLALSDTVDPFRTIATYYPLSGQCSDHSSRARMQWVMSGQCSDRFST